MNATLSHKTKVGGAALLALLTAVSLSGCGETRRALGYDKAPPDEFTVISRAPLSQPPDFTMRPPTPGAPRPQEGSTRDQAKNILVPGSASVQNRLSGQFSNRTQGEQSLLAKANAQSADPEIRRKVNEENTALVEADKSFTDKLLFWQDKPPPGTVVDASKEQKRLQDNAATGQSVTAGDTPQIVRRQKGWLEGIF